ncbi:MAG: hypothetical protein ACI9NI_002415 [Olleya marilimosa]|jgi:hypothetical protein|uniref:DUF1573 domain-containing protein n=1 Tax=Olleya marilimosa TaxID=272164 RepID=A0ABR8M067_9FLAO|nr:DUF1573 domain-containing protein [Olleya marilimosa]MBD3863622.1 DUF1573 domain-containing protein [Olleya marilimosa]MBD3891379.1 DUF1573 domain-containing protein [Olleya marilimosa]PIB30102.1 hypothetical protein BFP78_13645 [Gaetbulibacter sp. 5U11]|tara:strand:+ start:277213 stop:277728 length:516 start_codon:yes stop_codon:yes gene_type:complete
MKKVMILLSAVCLISLSSCKQDAAAKIDANNVAAASERDAQSGKLPVIEFDKKEHDFGEIVSGTPVETVFTYTNKGEAPLVITDIKSTCGCTVPQDWSRAPLAVGESDSFTVKFNGKGANKTSKVINITANTATGKESVKITAFITPDPNAPVKQAPLRTNPNANPGPLTQ